MPCYFQIVMKDSIKTAILLFFDAIALSRYIFIYWMKNPTALNDDFWNLFVNLWIILGSILININMIIIIIIVIITVISIVMIIIIVTILMITN